MKKFVIIRSEGASRVVTITSFIPKDWQAVEIHTVKEKKGEVTLKFEKVR